jgi:hypothetical protein
MAEPIQLSLFSDQVALIRIRSERTMAVWPDLFDRALLAHQGDRIGTQGSARLDSQQDAAAAINALARLAGTKRRRGGSRRIRWCVNQADRVETLLRRRLYQSRHRRDREHTRRLVGATFALR